MRCRTPSTPEPGIAARRSGLEHRTTARRYVVQLVDDLTGRAIDDGPGQSTRFALDGAQYTIDLSDEHASALRAVLAPYLAAARRTSQSGDAGRRAPANGRGARADAWTAADLGAMGRRFDRAMDPGPDCFARARAPQARGEIPQIDLLVLD